VDRQPSTPKTLTNGPRAPWEAQHKRVTFYCPTELLARIEKEIVRSGRSKTAVIVDAVRAELSGR
jgi:hypothetical protein